MASGTVNIGAINGGVAVDDNATGTGWIMYSAANVDTRFIVHPDNADHLVAVRLSGTQWQYNTNNAWVNFTPVSSDHLIAAVDFTANTAEMLGDRRFYYSQSAQCLEEHRAAELECQYLWGLRFVDDLVLRDRDSNRNGTLNERLYALHDLRFSVVALADPDSLIVERYTYDAYGVRTVLEPDYDSRAVSSYAFDFAYTGRRLDLDTGLYYFRARYYHPQLGVFIGRDPLEFVDGMNLYRAYFVPQLRDSTGTEIETECPIDDFLFQYVSNVGGSLVDTGPPYLYHNYGAPPIINTHTDVEIVSAMLAESHVFRIEGKTKDQIIKNFKKHIGSRERIVRNALNVRLGYPGGTNEPTSKAELLRQRQARRAKTGRGNPQESWNAINRPGNLLYCQNCANRIFETGTFDYTTGRGGFVGGRNRLGTMRFPVNSGVAFDSRIPQAVWIPGDRGDLHNLGFVQGATPHDLTDEAIIYVGGGLFFGHGFGKPKTELQWFKEIRSWGGGTGIPQWKATILFTTVGLKKR